jgi:hypothetical protein
MVLLGCARIYTLTFMAETGVENRIMGDLNAYSPAVSGPVSSLARSGWLVSCLALSPGLCRCHTCFGRAASGHRIIFGRIPSIAPQRNTGPDHPPTVYYSLCCNLYYTMPRTSRSNPGSREATLGAALRRRTTMTTNNDDDDEQR